MSPAETPEEVRRRLKSRADELSLDFQSAVQTYAVERFLYRLSMSRWAEKMVVKGAVMLRVWDSAITRPTRDIDFLGHVPNDPESLREIVAECLGAQTDDGLMFADVIDAVPITVENRYPGVRVKVAGDLAGARFVLRLDVGIDDAAVPEPAWADYPTLMDDPAPRILAYHPATAVAEKLQAMIEIGLSNSRLKDYHDIWALSRTLEFSGNDLVAAFSATFERRGTALPHVLPAELTAEFTEQPAVLRMWASYHGQLTAAGVETPRSLNDVAEEIAEFVMPPFLAAAAGVGLGERWMPTQGWLATR